MMPLPAISGELRVIAPIGLDECVSVGGHCRIKICASMSYLSMWAVEADGGGGGSIVRNNGFSSETYRMPQLQHPRYQRAGPHYNIIGANSNCTLSRALHAGKGLAVMSSDEDSR
jgi:hypothetical protein